MRMLPECGAGTLVTFMTGDGAVEYAQRCIWRVYSRKAGLRRGIVMQVQDDSSTKSMLYVRRVSQTKIQHDGSKK